MNLFTIDELKPDAATRAQMDTLQALLIREGELSAAIDRVIADRATADAAVTATTEELAEALARRALNPDTVPEATMKKLRASAAEALARRDGLKLAEEHLTVDHQKVEADIAAAAERTGPVFCGAHAARIVALAADRLQAAVVRAGGTSLRTLTVKIGMLADALRAPALQQWLTTLCVPGLGGPLVAPMLSGDAATRTAWRDDPELVEAHAVASEPQRLQAQLLAYTPRTTRLAGAVPYVRKGYTMNGRDRNEVPEASQIKPGNAVDATTPPPAPRAGARPKAWGATAPVADVNRMAAMQRRTDSGEPHSEFDPRPALLRGSWSTS